MTALAIGLAELRLDAEHLVEIGQGLVEIALLQIGESPGETVGRVVGGELQRLLDVGQRRVQIALHRPGVAPIAPGSRILRVELQGLVVVGHGRFPIAQFAVGLAAADVGRGILRIQPQGKIQVDQGLLPIALERANVTPIAIGFGIVGVQPYRLAIVGDGFVVLALLKVGETTIEIRPAAGGGQLDGRRQIGHRLVQLAFHGQGQAAITIGGGVFRVQLDRPTQQLEGRVCLALLQRLGPFAIGFGRRRVVGRVLLARLSLGLLERRALLRRPLLIALGWTKARPAEPQPRTLRLGRVGLDAQHDDANCQCDSQTPRRASVHGLSPLWGRPECPARSASVYCLGRELQGRGSRELTAPGTCDSPPLPSGSC